MVKEGDIKLYTNIVVKLNSLMANTSSRPRQHTRIVWCNRCGPGFVPIYQF